VIGYVDLGKNVKKIRGHPHIYKKQFWGFYKPLSEIFVMRSYKMYDITCLKQRLKDFDQRGIRFKQYTLKYSIREKDREWEHLWQAVKTFRTKISDPLQHRFEGLRFQDVTLVRTLLLTIILVLAFIIA